MKRAVEIIESDLIHFMNWIDPIKYLIIHQFLKDTAIFIERCKKQHIFLLLYALYEKSIIDVRLKVEANHKFLELIRVVKN